MVFPSVNSDYILCAKVIISFGNLYTILQIIRLPLQHPQYSTLYGLDSTVTDIRGKVDNINTHIDDVMKDAPDKLKVSVNVADADWQKMQDLFDQEHKWMLGKMQENIHQVNAMFVEERRKVQKRYKEYDGCYLGHYAQWFFWFFFVLGFFIFTAAIVMMVGKWCNWF